MLRYNYWSQTIIARDMSWTLVTTMWQWNQCSLSTGWRPASRLKSVFSMKGKDTKPWPSRSPGVTLGLRQARELCRHRQWFAATKQTSCCVSRFRTVLFVTCLYSNKQRSYWTPLNTEFETMKVSRSVAIMFMFLASWTRSVIANHDYGHGHETKLPTAVNWCSREHVLHCRGTFQHLSIRTVLRSNVKCLPNSLFRSCCDISSSQQTISSKRLKLQCMGLIPDTCNCCIAGLHWLRGLHRPLLSPPSRHTSPSAIRKGSSCECETWSVFVKEEHRLNVWEQIWA